jgi:hypothetical protein
MAREPLSPNGDPRQRWMKRTCKVIEIEQAILTERGEANDMDTTQPEVRLRSFIPPESLTDTPPTTARAAPTASLTA